jgi:diaminopropionate ammonia-lyase
MFPSALPIRYFLNPRADPSLAYGPERAKILNRRAHEAAFKEISSWDGYAATPLLSLEGMAGRLGIETLWYKDEGARFGLKSFKALGGIYGVFRVLQPFLEGETGIPGIGSSDFSRSRFAELLSDFTVTCASAGNHGGAVARGADLFGCRSVVFLPSHTPSHRVEAIEELGARTVPVKGSYDDAVALAAREAERNGWSVVADTTYPGYEEVPRHIMQGYTVLVREVLEQLPGGLLPTHLFLQAGVGGLAAAVTGHLWEKLGRDRPRIVVVEPAEADCLLESALGADPVPSSGSLSTSMECLACRNASTLAWKILEEGADAFLTIPDLAAEETE